MKENDIVWQPQNPSASNMAQLIKDINQRYSNANCTDYDSLHRWSIDNLEPFWAYIWEHAQIRSSQQYTRILNDDKGMFGATWFEGARLNMAEHFLRNRSDKTAILYANEQDHTIHDISCAQLYNQVSKTIQALRQHGICKGDRVAAVVANRPESVIIMLATVAIGAIYSSCSPDFGEQGLLSRLGQIEPSILFATRAYYYKGKIIDCQQKIDKLRKAIPSIQKTIILDYASTNHTIDCDVFGAFIHPYPATTITFEQLPLSHPIYILYSSGTTGKPKCIVHGAGALLQIYKEHVFHSDMRPNDIVFFYTTCGWMMWNWLVHALVTEATVCLYDGSPFYPTPDALWQFAQKTNMTIMGVSPGFLKASEDFGVQPQNCRQLRTILTAGSPLLIQHYDYIYRHLPTIQLSSITGGTDIVSLFLGDNPLLPVRVNQIQCKTLGMAVEAFDDYGQPVERAKEGELVCIKPFPTQPLMFWNDEHNIEYKAAYFETYPGMWHHGDYITVYPEGGITVWGRSDATLNAGGVRMGSAEFYTAIEHLEPLHDSLVTTQGDADEEYILLFIVLKDGYELTDELRNNINHNIATKCSPRHVPKKIIAAPDIPYTLNGKKVEIAVKKILNDKPVTNTEAIANPESLAFFHTI